MSDFELAEQSARLLALSRKLRSRDHELAAHVAQQTAQKVAQALADRFVLIEPAALRARDQAYAQAGAVAMVKHLRDAGLLRDEPSRAVDVNILHLPAMEKLVERDASGAITRIVERALRDA